MPDEVNSLVHEVERLVTAPYVPSLQNLHDIVRNVSSATIGSWIACKPCQVGLLVGVLVEALSRSSMALELLCAFGSAPAVRDALLVRYPAILDKFLEQAVDNEESEYIPTCIALLSSPLPDSFLAPARLAPFITKLVGRMTGNPCEETIAPIYRLMTGLQGSPGVLNEIPCETMSNLQLELTKALRNLDDHMGNLLCLATFARIANSDIQQHGPQPPSWLENIQHFFGPKRSLKTLDLVVLRVILACSASCSNLEAGKAAESVRLAIEICENVEPDRKNAWIEGNSSKIAKLREKVMREGIGQEVQMMGVMFLISVLPVPALSAEIPRLGLHGLVSMSSRRVLEIMPSELIPRVVEVVAISVGEPAIHSLLNYVFSGLKAEFSTGGSAISTANLARLFLSGLRNLDLQPLGSRARDLASSLGRETVLKLIEHFPRQPSHPQCDGSIACHTELAASENKLLIDLLDFWSLSPSLDNNAFGAPGTNCLTVFMTQVQRNLSGGKCVFTAAKPLDFRHSFALPDRQQNPSIYPRRDWKAGIAETVTSNAHNLHENMMKQVQEICRDLEHRCYDTEAPLRAVEEERDMFYFETEDLKRQKAELEDRIQQSSSAISSLQHLTTSLEKHAESVSAHAEDLSTKLEAVQNELEEQRRYSEEMAHRENEKARTKELDLVATLTEKEDQLEELQGEIHEHRVENEEVRKTLDSVSKEKAVSLENAISLRQEIAKLEDIIESNRRSATEKGEEIQQLLADKQRARVESEAFENQLEGATTECNGLRSALSEAEKHSASEMEATKQQYELQLSNTNAECVKQRQENKSLRSDMQAAASDADQELQTKDRRIQRLENKVQSLQDERAATAREFSEAQQHMGRLMSVMGFQRNAGESEQPNKHRSTFDPSQGAATRQQMQADEADTQTQLDPQLGESFGSPTPSCSGPTPKRSKGSFCLQRTPSAPPRSSFNQKTKVLPTRSRTGQRHERRPLGEADQNSPLKQRHGISKSNSAGAFHESQVNTHSGENHVQDIDLDTDYLFTSTCFSEANGRIDSFNV